METDIWLWAQLYSREFNPTLSFFFQILFKIRDGYKFPSKELVQEFPELQHILKKLNPQDEKNLRSAHLRAVERGDQILYPGHDLYPRAFLTLEIPPYFLSMRGSPIWLGGQGLSVVGSRDPSILSLQWMDEHLAKFCREKDVFIISGGARGVDQKSHMVCLRAQKPTVAFLPSGLENIYPANLRTWVPAILETGGCLLSEYEAHFPMKKDYFPQRNRLIAALGKATLIVEARRQSGTYITAQRSLEQSKPLWILPGHPMDPGMGGSLDLLADGGTPVRDAADLGLLFDSEIQNFSCFDQDSNKYLV